jgi:hypothetical protein
VTPYRDSSAEKVSKKIFFIRSPLSSLDKIFLPVAKQTENIAELGGSKEYAYHNGSHANKFK